MKLRYIIVVVLFVKIAASDSDSVIRVKTPPSLAKTERTDRTVSPSRSVNPPTSPRDQIHERMRRNSQKLLLQNQQLQDN